MALRKPFNGDPMAIIMFALMTGVIIYVLALPGNPLSPISSNATFTSAFGNVSAVFVGQGLVPGLLALAIPLAGFTFLREWGRGKEDEE